MKILFIGDIFGSPGRETVKKVLPGIKKEFSLDFIIANAENMAHGDGFSRKTIKEMQSLGIDFFTSGNHAWAHKESAKMIEDDEWPIVRPANYPPGVPGKPYAIAQAHDGSRVLVVNLLGRSFMRVHYECPFRVMDAILEETRDKDIDAIFVDYHAETTSEKYALGFYLDGRVNAVIGTHTHVATADARILPNGTAYMSDVGMVGPYDSVIGIKKEIIIERMMKQLPVQHEPETGGAMIFNSVLIELDSKTKKTLNIKHVQQIL